LQPHDVVVVDGINRFDDEVSDITCVNGQLTLVLDALNATVDLQIP